LWGAHKTAIPLRLLGIRIDFAIELDRAVERESNDDTNEEVRYRRSEAFQRR
jgi:hypothetical protein